MTLATHKCYHFDYLFTLLTINANQILLDLEMIISLLNPKI